MIRPQAKKQKEHREMLQKLEKGDRILTAGGIVGTIAGVKESEGLLIVKIADNVKIEVSRSSVGQVLKKKSQS
jgi:preprotein translocase subunit YajC